MLLSIVSGLDESKSSPNDVNKKFTYLCRYLKSLNYDGIELSLLEPEKVDVKGIIELQNSYDMKISALGTGSTFIRFGYSLGDHRELIRKKAIERVAKYIEFARETQSKVIIGLIRGRYKHDSNPQKEQLNIISSLKECCSIAENSDVQLLFEPINRFEIDSYHTISESIQLINEILIDSYHTHLEEDPVYIWKYLKDIVHYIGHVHLADTTRRAPGSGHFDFKAFLSIFKTHGYSEFVSIETIMKPSFELVAKNSSEYLRQIL
ncbi:MAG: sugar phosphate isomerase/epimerase family protein [Candidatus Hermodarchaeota archaeon]